MLETLAGPQAMAFYCGVATKQNRLRWFLCGLFTTLTLIFVILARVMAIRCAKGVQGALAYALQTERDEFRADTDELNSPDPFQADSRASQAYLHA